MRLNGADTYDAAVFTAAGIQHFHLEFPDCTVAPPPRTHTTPTLPQRHYVVMVIASCISAQAGLPKSKSAPSAVTACGNSKSVV